MAVFEGQERRMPKIEACLKEYGFESLDAVRDYCLEKGIDVDKIVKGVQPIAFENASWAYTLGVGIALKKNCVKAADAAHYIGVGLQAFCVPRLCRGTPPGRPGPRRPRFDASERRDRMLLLPRRS